MLYIAKAEVTVYPYMEDTRKIEKNFTVEAESQEQAANKIHLYYDEKDEGTGGTQYYVNYVEFFEHIS